MVVQMADQRRRVAQALLGAVVLAAGFVNAAAPHAAAASLGPVLVLVAHPDDEALGPAGVIEQAVADGRQVYVAVVTNGDSGSTGTASGYCGAPSGNPATTAMHGLARDKETLAGMGLLGLSRSSDPLQSHIFFLGYPAALDAIASSSSPYTGDAVKLHHTYAEDGDNNNATCNGDLRYLLSGSHSTLTSSALAADFDSLLALTHPTDIYTHSAYDGHAEHVVVADQLFAAVVRAGISVSIHQMLIHPHGSGDCLYDSAYTWPNPTDDGNPFHRFTPTLDITAPPADPCSTSTASTWGTPGPPNEMVAVPADMRATTESANKKMQVILKYTSQMSCTPNSGVYHPSCGYMRGFVKAHEWFWKVDVGPAFVPVNIALPSITGTPQSATHSRP